MTAPSGLAAFDLAWAQLQDLMLEQDELLGPNDGEVPRKLSKQQLARCEELRLALRAAAEAMEHALAKREEEGSR